MDKDVAQYVRNCHTCRRIKASREASNGTLKPLPVPERRWEDVPMNFVIDLPSGKNIWGVACKSIMVVVDQYRPAPVQRTLVNMDVCQCVDALRI
jgi:hypothetical protein